MITSINLIKNRLIAYAKPLYKLLHKEKKNNNIKNEPMCKLTNKCLQKKWNGVANVRFEHCAKDCCFDKHAACLGSRAP